MIIYTGIIFICYFFAMGGAKGDNFINVVLSFLVMVPIFGRIFGWW